MSDDMRILLLVPQPFYIVRGSPIAVDLILKVLSERSGQVDAVTYHLGHDVEYEKVTLYRTPRLPFIRDVGPGFSWRKVVCDLLLLFKGLRLAATRRYHLVHAVEESVFLALLFKWLFRIPYVYDMDSSLAQQMVEQFSWLSPVYPALELFEKLAVRNAKAVVAVCDALASHAARFQPGKVVVLPDISLVDDGGQQTHQDLRTELGIGGLLLMYVGNLQPYQGIDLLLEGTKLAFGDAGFADLVIIGGAPTDIHRYEDKSRQLGIDERVHFLGPKSLDDLGYYLSQADILVSPRIAGENTPMKIYSYLGSGKPILATNLPTHTQVLDHAIAQLVDPTPRAFADGQLQLIKDEALRLRLGAAGRMLAEDRYSFEAFRRRCNDLFDWLETELDPGRDRDIGLGPTRPQKVCVDDGR
jgi:glycosyltransferase involved in cell wall biosynthesis